MHIHVLATDKYLICCFSFIVANATNILEVFVAFVFFGKVYVAEYYIKYTICCLPLKAHILTISFPISIKCISTVCEYIGNIVIVQSFHNALVDLNDTEIL